MKKTFFNKEIDFSLPEINIHFDLIGDIKITTRNFNGEIWAKFHRYTPNSWVEFTIDEDLTGIRAQYMMLDSLERKTKSIKPL